jgi:hypothetical protein
MEDKFYPLFECYISGQMSERQWQEHLTNDVGLKEWFENFKKERKAAMEQKQREYYDTVLK